jgi:chromosome segregation ATPase
MTHFGLLDCVIGSDLRYRKDRDEEGHMADWDKAKAAALKILGNKAVVPDLPASINKASETFDKTNDAFKASREDCEDKLLEIEDATSALGNAVKQFQATIEKSDFKLDSKNKDEAKKIQQAQKILTGELSSASKQLATITKILDELDKHLIQLGKYKPSDPPLK